MKKALLLRLPLVAVLSAALISSPGAAAAQTSIGLEVITSPEHEESIPMFAMHFQSSQRRAFGFDVGLSSCGYLNTVDAAITFPEFGRDVRLVPRIGISALGIGAFGAIAGPTAGFRLAAGRPGRPGIALDMSAVAYPEIATPLYRVGLSCVWGGSRW